MIHKGLIEGGISVFQLCELMFASSAENDDRGNICLKVAPLNSNDLRE